MGGSSVLAAVALSAISTFLGRDLEKDDLVHLVSRVEQGAAMCALCRVCVRVWVVFVYVCVLWMCVCVLCVCYVCVICGIINSLIEHAGAVMSGHDSSARALVISSSPSPSSSFFVFMSFLLFFPCPSSPSSPLYPPLFSLALSLPPSPLSSLSPRLSAHHWWRMAGSDRGHLRGV